MTPRLRKAERMEVGRIPPIQPPAIVFVTGSNPVKGIQINATPKTFAAKKNAHPQRNIKGGRQPRPQSENPHLTLGPLFY